MSRTAIETVVEDAVPVVLYARGEHYDVDGDPMNGCERADDPGHHRPSDAFAFPTTDCYDSHSAISD